MPCFIPLQSVVFASFQRLCQSHIQRDWDKAVNEVSADGRLIQRSFWRAFRRDAEGDVDESLIPKDILDWYEDSDDEEETVEEVEGDVEEI